MTDALAPFIHAMGRGPSRARHLTGEEACRAMEIILSGTAAPEATGALLMLMRYRGETPDEIAGFARAARKGLDRWSALSAAVDWPSYAAGRSRGAPFFLLAAKLVAQAGFPVVLHGWNSHQAQAASVRAALPALGIARATTPEAAQQALAQDGLVYLALEDIAPALFDVLQLRRVLGLRSCVNTVSRMLNPTGADLMVQGVFHPSYRDLQIQAAALLGQPDLAVIKGGGGEFERHPGKDIDLWALRSGQAGRVATPAIDAAHRRLNSAEATPETLWSGAAEDPFAQSVVTGTAALVLWMLRAAPDTSSAQGMADALWQARVPDLAA